MKCYHCKQQIDDDSLFCDQCGERIWLCPQCHTPGKGQGKRCGQCGSLLIEASATSCNHTDSGSSANQAVASRLVSREMGLIIELSDGLVLGRLEGKYASMLAPLKFVSARHAVIRRDAEGWIIADEGSRNGTAVNGQWAYTPLHFKAGDIVRLGNAYDFIAE